MDKETQTDRQEIYKNLDIILLFMINTTTPSKELVHLMQAREDIARAVESSKQRDLH